jgi:hypothetical protein
MVAITAELLTARDMVSPNEGNEVRREGRTGVGASRSTVEPGELT